MTLAVSRRSAPGPFASAGRAFLRSPTGVAALGIALVLAALAIVGPIVWGDTASRLDVFAAGQGPSPQHTLGTDRLGRDVVARTLAATRLSLGLGVLAAALAAVLGVGSGIVIASSPTRLRAAGLRAIDVMLSFPYLLTVIFVAAIVGVGTESALLAVAVASAPYYARVSAALALSIAGREFVASAKVIGIGQPRLLLRYVLPNIADTLAISTFFAIANAIVAMSSLSFLGLGVQPPLFDWGRMLTEGVHDIYSTPMAALAPATLIAATGLATGFLGEAVARAMNPLVWTDRKPAIGVVRKPAEPHTSSTAPIAGGETVLQVEHLVVRFPSGSAPVDGLSFTVARGESVGIVGESGSGKTLTALAVAQLAPYPSAVEARVRFLGHDLAALGARERAVLLGTRLAMVFQDPMASLNPALRIGRQLTEAVRHHRGMSRRHAEALALERLRDVGIAAPEARLRQYPHELSGGMRQRAMIAMGLMDDPALIIADEPTTSLDVTLQAQIVDLLRDVQRRHGTAILLISHDIGLVAQLCGRVLVMYAGRIVEEIDTAALLAGAAHPYTHALIGAVPDPAADRRLPLVTIAGRPPDPAAIPPGCAFAARCPNRIARCVDERPELVLRGGPDHRVACWNPMTPERLEA